MLISDYKRSASLSERARQRMRRLGTNFRGIPLWSEAENEILRQLPIKQAQERLPHRTLSAIVNQRSKLGLGKQIHFWTAAEISRLRRMYPRCSKEEICAMFPHSTWINIGQVARSHGFRREKPPYKRTRHAVLDQIREKCQEINWTLVDLDREANTKYFASGSSIQARGLNYKAIGRALNILQGRMLIEWADED
ncbi:hypothetical protein GOB34_20585 [Sinorhizobium meliloti]|nr:hypothetical protein [Sinorhizobium meliloti]